MVMTPKEKAIELVEKYTELGKDFTRGVSMKEFAKQCALIAVDEILFALEIDAGNWIKWNETQKFWNQVKQEIEKL